MLTFFGTDLLMPEWSSSTVCIGVFDGVHLGHLAVIRAAVAEAEKHGEPCVLMTFDRHPAWILAPDRVPMAIATLSQNLERFSAAGVVVCVVEPFDRETSQTPATAFLQDTLIDKLRAKRLVIGHDFALGHGREGTPEWLGQHIETTVVPPFEMNGHRVSSSEIRTAVASGDVHRASLLLGHDFCLRGVVAHGQKLGREIGYPTINLALSTPQLVPLAGIYAGTAKTVEGEFTAAMSVGTRPTVGGSERTIEAYLLDYPGNEIYGTEVDLRFTHRIRDELKFKDLDELKENIARDVDEVRKRVSRNG